MPSRYAKKLNNNKYSGSLRLRTQLVSDKKWKGQKFEIIFYQKRKVTRVGFEPTPLSRLEPYSSAIVY